MCKTQVFQNLKPGFFAGNPGFIAMLWVLILEITDRLDSDLTPSLFSYVKSPMDDNRETNLTQNQEIEQNVPETNETVKTS